MTEQIETPKWFSVTAIIALVWNLLGVMAFISHIMMTSEMLAELSQAEQQLYNNTPLWATIAFALSVCAGALGSLALLFKKTIAGQLLILSLISVLVQMFHSFFIIDSMAVYGPGGLVMPIMVIIIAISLVFLAKNANKNGWLES